MEQNNNTNVVDKKMDELMEGMKAQISAEVKAELQEKGIEVIPLDYSAGTEIVKLVDDYKSQIEEIDKKNNELIDNMFKNYMLKLEEV